MSGQTLKFRPAATPNVLVGTRLRELRVQAHMTQEFLAMRLGLPNDSIGRIERGTERLSADAMFAACEIFQVQPKFFFSEAV